MKKDDWKKNLQKAKPLTMKNCLQLSKILFWAGIICLPIGALFVIPWLQTDYVIYFVLMLFVVLLSLVMIAYSALYWGYYSKFFPLNSLKEFEIDFRSEDDVFKYGRFVNDNGTFAIEVKEKESGVWVVCGQEKNIRIDLYSYPYPEEYIAGFFVRNFNYADYDKSDKSFSTIYKKREISWLNKINDVKLIFCFDGKQKEVYVVKNKTTQLKFFTYQLMYQTVQHIVWQASASWSAIHQKGNEREFRNFCNFSVFVRENRRWYWDETLVETYPKSEIYDENGNPLYPDNDTRLSHPKYSEQKKK